MRIAVLTTLLLVVGLIVYEAWPRWTGPTLPEIGPGVPATVHRDGGNPTPSDASVAPK